MEREYKCQSFCFGYRGKRWKVGEDVVLDPGEVPNAHFLKHFVLKNEFKVPDLTVIGGPRIDGVLKKIERVTDTAMSPDTKRLLENQGKEKLAGAPIEENIVPVENDVEKSIVKRGRRIGSKNK
jgi:hypothetical protein